MPKGKGGKRPNTACRKNMVTASRESIQKRTFPDTGMTEEARDDDVLSGVQSFDALNFVVEWWKAIRKMG